MTEKVDYTEDVERPLAVFDTSMGVFEAEFYAKECPETVWNFINLSEGRQKTEREGNFYDGLTFHRIIPGFVIQGGCPQGTGTGSPGYRFKDEFDPSLRHDSEGVFSMAGVGHGKHTLSAARQRRCVFHGQRRPGYQRQSVFHHTGRHPSPGQPAYRFR